MKKMRNPLYGLIVLTLFLSPCNLPFGSAAVPVDENPLAALGLPPTSTLQPLMSDEPTNTEKPSRPQQPELTPCVIERCNTLIKDQR